MENQRKFLESFAKLNGFKVTDFHNWYSVSKKDIAEEGGLGLLARYNDSVSQMVAKVFPEFDFLPWQFDNSPRNIWKDFEIVKKAVVFAENRLDIKKPDEWYRVSIQQISDIGLGTLISHYGNLIEALKSVYPNEKWNENLIFGGLKKASQRWLGNVVKEIWPNETIKEDFRDLELVYGKSSQPMQFDFFLPDIKIAFEFQGLQHYQGVPIFGNTTRQLKKDLEKVKKCEEKGITLIHVPYWWGGERGTLLASIIRTRPDLKSVIRNDFVLEAMHFTSLE